MPLTSTTLPEATSSTRQRTPCFSTGALGQESGPVVEHAWARATSGSAKTGAVYMTITSPTPDALVAAASPVAGRAGLHEDKTENGVMRMRPTPSIPVEPGKPTELKPGGDHVMLMDLKQPLKAGETFPLTVTFEKAGSKQVTVRVEKAGALT